MKFKYLVRNQQGEIQAGTIGASNYPAALKALQDRNLIVMKLKSGERNPLFAKRIKLFERVKRKEIFIFFRQLSILIDADVHLVQSLKTLAQQSEAPILKEIIFDIANEVDGGVAFSKALSKYPKIFSTFTVNLIKTGEVSGQLQETLNYLADHLEREYYLISKVRGAMVYPAFILGTFIIVGVLVLVMVIPPLTSILIEAEQELPLSTKIVIFTSQFTIKWGWLALIFLIIFGIFFWRYQRTESGKAFLDKFKLNIPIIGKILRKTYLARLADSLSALVKGGVSIIQGLSITGEVIDNYVFKKIIFQARDEVKIGRNISTAFEIHKEIPPLFSQMIKTGERTGKLETILEKLSLFYNKEVENVVNNLTQLIEPILIIGLAIGVSILVFAVFMPIYNLAGAF
ncbi:MAG: type II secretion system F family protein [Patescibacteria group bacterium]